MTFVDLVRACYPLLIANDDETYWIGQFGTCFLAQRTGRLFAVTARHCVTPAAGAHLAIACHEREFAPLFAAYQRTHARELQSDEEDLYIAEVDRTRMSPGYRAALAPLNLDGDPPMHLLHPAPDPEICIPGFPMDRSGIEYERKVIAPKPTIRDRVVRHSARHRLVRMEKKGGRGKGRRTKAPQAVFKEIALKIAI